MNYETVPRDLKRTVHRQDFGAKLFKVTGDSFIIHKLAGEVIIITLGDEVMVPRDQMIACW